MAFEFNTRGFMNFVKQFMADSKKKTKFNFKGIEPVVIKTLIFD